jgi:hypothetical protein
MIYRVIVADESAFWFPFLGLGMIFPYLPGENYSHQRTDITLSSPATTSIGASNGLGFQQIELMQSF